MKYLNFLTCFTCSFFFFFLNEIIPQCDETNCLGYYAGNNSNAIIVHSHDPDGIGNCIGYALAETQQSYLGTICGLAKEISIDEAYAKNYWLTWGFYNKYNFNGSTGTQANDILIWDLEPNNIDYRLRHAAVVNYSGSGYISIRWIDANQPGNDIQNSSLSSSNNYYAPGYGTPSYFVRRNQNNKTYGYAITLKTSFNGGTLKIDGVSYNINGSGGTVVTTLSRDDHTLEADDRQYNGSVWVGYKEWKNKNDQPIASDPVRTTIIDLNSFNGFGETFKAMYVSIYNVTVQNNFVGLSYTGNVKVNDVLYSAPKTTEVKEGGSVKFEIPNDEQNGIKYQFNHWQDGNTQNPRTYYNILNGFNVTAYYRGKPSTANRNLTMGTVVGQPIILYWNEHPNVNVTQYKIWRKVKHNGVMGGEYLIATKNRGTTSCVDNDYTLTNGYTDDLLFYDVRPYYSIENTYSDPSWMPVYGEILYKSADSLFTTNQKIENSISNFPNPFNPVTSISYSIEESGLVNVKVFDLLGQQIVELVNEEKEAGNYSISFNASQLPSGIYLYTINSKNFTQSRKMLLMK